MFSFKARGALMRLLSVSIICMGFAQVAPAGVIGTAYMLDEESRAASLSRIEVVLAREDVGKQLEAFGVARADVIVSVLVKLHYCCCWWTIHSSVTLLHSPHHTLLCYGFLSWTALSVRRRASASVRWFDPSST